MFHYQQCPWLLDSQLDESWMYIMILDGLIFAGFKGENYNLLNSMQSSKACRDCPGESKLQWDLKYGSWSASCLGEGESQVWDHSSWGSYNNFRHVGLMPDWERAAPSGWGLEQWIQTDFPDPVCEVESSLLIGTLWPSLCSVANMGILWRLFSKIRNLKSWNNLTFLLQFIIWCKEASVMFSSRRSITTHKTLVQFCVTVPVF